LWGFTTNNSPGDISGTALNTKERGRSSKRGNHGGYGRSQSQKSQLRGTQLTCWNCKKKGHLKRDCRASKKKMEENDKSSTSMNVSNESGSENEALIMWCDSKDDCLWILDYGASVSCHFQSGLFS
jgi:Zinc knuckle